MIFILKHSNTNKAVIIMFILSINVCVAIPNITYINGNKDTINHMTQYKAQCFLDFPDALFIFTCFFSFTNNKRLQLKMNNKNNKYFILSPIDI